MPRLNQALNSLIDASVYAPALPRPVRDFVGSLASRPDNPVSEFWYAQKKAIDSQLLDLTRTAVVVSLPTSAGKTLLAELAIIQAHTDEPAKKIVYIAPTRALVTQIALRLRADLGPRQLIIQSTTSGFELDPVENAILTSPYHVLVTTPEKLDLLVRTGHSAVAELSLVVVDEAHNIGDRERGARLELLLSTLRREKARCRFLLLTPFANNAPDLARWLGGAEGVPILLDWKPNDRVVGTIRAGRMLRHSRELLYTTLESAHSDCPGGISIPIGQTSDLGVISKKAISSVAARSLAAALQGGVLVLVSSRDDAEQRAKEIASKLGREVNDPDVDLVSRFILTETGGDHPLPPLLRKGVAFHHAGLSPECRYLLERLIENDRVSVVCATTTLAQGVHFPLSAAVIESLTRRSFSRAGWISEEIDPQEFWNVVGRVGRALEYSLGSVLFVARNEEDSEKAQKFLRRDATTVASSVAQMMEAISSRPPSFSIGMLERHRPMSAFLQYILHAIAVGNEGDIKPDSLESLIRNSFAFLQAEQSGQDATDRLLAWARAYVDVIKHQKGDSLQGYAEVADGTGFSSPSVDQLLQEWTHEARVEDWTAEKFYPTVGTESSTLTRAIDSLGRIPEIHLGSYEEGKFDPARIARITTGWVNGVSIWELARQEYKGDVLDCYRHIYSAVTSLLPWGLRAIERVGFSGNPKADWDKLSMLQAMALHGVRSPHAVGLRLIGVPRFVAERLGEAAATSGIETSDLRSWLESSDSSIWERALPSDARITAAECRQLWKLMDGTIGWDDLFGRPRGQI